LSVARDGATVATTPIEEVVVGVCGCSGDGSSRPLVLEVRGDLLQRLMLVGVVGATGRPELIGVGIAIALAGWMGAESSRIGLPGRGRCECDNQRADQKNGGLDAC